MTSRLSIAEVMTLVFLAALDIRSIRSFLFHEGGPTDMLLSTGGPPMLNVLGLCFLLSRRKSRRMESAPFLIGFEIGGGLALLLYAASCVLLPVSLLNHFKSVFSPLIPYLASSGSRYFIQLLELAAMAYFTTLLLIPALIAGWYARRRKRDVPNLAVSGR